MKRVFLGLGSNLGEREANLAEALERLEGPRLKVVKKSSIYETEPIGPPGQQWYLNQVVEIETSLLPMMLIQRLLRVEKEMGRRRTVRNGPRNIDIDVLLYGRFVVNSPKLTVPHPRMTQRRFVLEPLAEIAPELRHPQSRRTIRELLETVKGQAVKKL